jgi:hypothetical protein
MAKWQVDPPPHELAAVGGGAPSVDRVQYRRRLLRQPKAQPKLVGRRRRRWAEGLQRCLPRCLRHITAPGDNDDSRRRR